MVEATTSLSAGKKGRVALALALSLRLLDKAARPRLPFARKASDHCREDGSILVHSPALFR